MIAKFLPVLVMSLWSINCNAENHEEKKHANQEIASQDAKRCSPCEKFKCKPKPNANEPAPVKEEAPSREYRTKPKRYRPQLPEPKCKPGEVRENE